MKKVFLIFLIIVGVSVLLSASFSWLPFKKQEEKAKVTKDIDLIELDIGAISTEIISEDRDTVEADLVGKGKLNVRTDGDTITVQFERKWFDFLSLFKRNKLTVYIPEGYDRDMKIDIGSGNINYDARKLDQLAVDVGSGNINIKNLTVKDFKLDVSSGNVNIKSLKANSSRIDISSGNVELNNYSGKLKADLSSGNFDARIDQLIGAIDIDVSSGKVELDLPDKADFTLKGKIGSGKISTDFLLTTTKQENKYIQGVHGTGKHKVNLKVSSGKIDVY
ncbi:LiaG family protein [Metabacillus fastidiosus]|uniref:LiaG family protein n=1 Tax=Metabacillus fastidiosus TaxID=1458 RepID=UPI003D284EC9